MGSLAGSDLFVAVAWAAGIGSLSVAAALALEVLHLRRRAARRARRRAEFLASWRPVLFEAALGGAIAVPALDARDGDAFLALWNDVQDVLHGESRAALNRIAEAVGTAATARRCLRRGHPVARVQALRALGHLQQAEDYDAVRAFLDEPRAYLSLTAARALVRIDPARAPADLLPRMAARADWPASLLVTALARSGREALAPPLRAACAEASPARLVRLLPLVELVDERTAEDVLRSAFASAADPEVIASVLKHARTPALADLARAGCSHPQWSVRTQAAAALSRIGAAADRALLLALLTDAQWWVRYRAAQALVSGRFGDPDELGPLVAALDDRFSRDIVAHALAERRA